MSTHVSATRRVDPPDRVSVGLLTQTGLGTSLVMFVSAIIDAIAGDVIDSDTRLLIAGGIATVIATIFARAYQAGKLIAARHGIDLPDQPLR